MTNIESYKRLNNIQKSTWAFITTFFLEEEQIEEAKKAFLALDKNNDGTLTPQEIKEGYNFYISSDKPAKEIDEIIQSLDLNQNGKIDYTEFILAAVKREEAISEANLIKAFELLDLDDNGSINLKEMKLFFQGASIPENIWSEIFKDLDKDGDKVISYPEFKANVLVIIKKLKDK